MPLSWGTCEDRKRAIELEHRADSPTLLMATCHEFGHVFFPDLNEEVVQQFGEELSGLLVRMGYARE